MAGWNAPGTRAVSGRDSPRTHATCPTSLTTSCPYTGKVPTIRSLLAHPERRRPSPPAPRADLYRVFGGGMVLFAVALIVTLVLHLTGRGGIDAVAICATGIVLGGLGLLWARRHR